MFRLTRKKPRDVLHWLAPSLGHMQNFYAMTLARILVSFIPMADFFCRHDVNPLRMASFGAGSCSHEAFLADIYPRARMLCIDMSEKYIPPYTKRKIADSRNIEFRAQPVESIDWETYRHAYDLLFSIQTLEHVADPGSALRNLAACVAPLGYLYIDTPFYSERDDQETAEYLATERRRQWEKHAHRHLGFSLFRMADRVRRLGFEIVELGYSSYVQGDSAVLQFVRGKDVLTKAKSDASFILGIAGTMHTLLTRCEDLNRHKFEEIDRCRHKGRPVLAIRLLAQKSAAG